MLLIISAHDDATVTFMLPQIREAGISFRQIDLAELSSQSKITWRMGKNLSSLTHEVNGEPLDLASVNAVWYRKPNRLKINTTEDAGWDQFILQENQKLWGSYFREIQSARWINQPSANHSASFKPEQLSRARKLGFTIPETIITNSPTDAAAFYHAHSGEIIIKPLNNGYVERETPEKGGVIFCNKVRPDNLDQLNQIENCSVLLQAHIKKRSDFRVTVVGNEIFPVRVFSQEVPTNQVDFRRNNMTGLRYETAELPKNVSENIRKLMKFYQLTFGAIDLIETESGDFTFLEINPNGQWAWLEQAIGVPISRALIREFKNEHA